MEKEYCVDENDVLVLLYEIKKVMKIQFDDEKKIKFVTLKVVRPGPISLVQRIIELSYHLQTVDAKSVISIRIHKFIMLFLKEYNLKEEDVDINNTWRSLGGPLQNLKEHAIVNKSFKYSIYQVMHLHTWIIKSNYLESIDNILVRIFQNNKSIIKEMIFFDDSADEFWNYFDGEIKKNYFIMKQEIYLF